MFEKIDFEEAAGKTIRAVIRPNDDELLVSFDDDTFSLITSERYCDDTEIDTNGYFDPLCYRLDLCLTPAFGEGAAWEIHNEAKKKQEAKADGGKKHSENGASNMRA